LVKKPYVIEKSSIVQMCQNFPSLIDYLNVKLERSVLTETPSSSSLADLTEEPSFCIEPFRLIDSRSFLLTLLREDVLDGFCYRCNSLRSYPRSL